MLLLGQSPLFAAEIAAPDFQKEILPLLKSRCVACHGPAKQEGKLNLALPPGIKRGGKSGPAIVANHVDQSLLWTRVSTGEMPVDQPLAADEQELLRRWIAAGAPGLPAEVAAEPTGDEHWAFQPLGPITIPTVTDEPQLRTPVDQFIAARLKSVGLKLSPEANRETLVRRVSFDLTGLPPSLEEIDAFLSDQRTDAYEQMVERYLNSERYGERWGKYWLDAAGYADSNGYFNADTDRPLAYRYRDYVIRSLNADKPWDQFIREQLAGDEIAGYHRGGEVRQEMVELLEAVHFLRNSQDGTDSSDGNPDEVRADKYSVLEGTQQIIGSALFGMTVHCARCHDHKFEPFSQRDYYGLQAVIYPAFNVDQWVLPRDREISTATAAELAAWEAQVKAVDEQVAARGEEFAAWARLHRQHGRELFADSFEAERPLAEAWSNTVPGDTAPAGMPAIQLDQKTAPAAEVSLGRLHLIESGSAGDRALSTRKTFDWTPDEKGGWIQATFDLVSGGDAAPYVGYFIALRDFNDAQPTLTGGNVLLDGAAAGQAAVHVDYPGADDQGRGKIGKSGYTPGRNYGVRITNLGGNKYEVRQVVDGVPEDGTVTLAAADLPDGAFGFEYCCGRSFLVDNVLIEQGVPDSQLDAAERKLADEHRAQRKKLDAAIKALEATRPKPVGRLASVSEPAGAPPVVRLLTRGEYKHPGDVVGASAPHVLSELVNSTETSATQTTAGTTGQRLAFARWLTQPNSRAAALFARVTVNRWWQHHFGTGIVATADNLGYSGSLPSHPELLDFLAGELIRQQWSAKAIHRLILHSSAYRQSSTPVADAERVDPDGRLLAAFPLRRLDGEAIRDAMLSIAGELDPLMFGPYVATKPSAEGEIVVAEDTAGSHRRSLYLQQRRTQVVGMLEVFDAPTIVFNCTSRAQTTVPLQSLKLLNSEFIRERAAGLARRVRSSPDVSDELAVTRAFRLAWGRGPTEEESLASRRFLVDQIAEYGGQSDPAWVDFCQMLLASNAFLYIE